MESKAYHISHILVLTNLHDIAEFPSVYISNVRWNSFQGVEMYSTTVKYLSIKIQRSHCFFFQLEKSRRKGWAHSFFYQIPLMKSVTHNTFIHLYFILTVVIRYFICLGYYLSYFSSYCNVTRWYYYLIFILHWMRNWMVTSL